MADDAYGEMLQRQILKAYGLDNLTPDERAVWDAYNRAMDAVDAVHKASEAQVLRNGKAVTAYINANPTILDDLMPGASAVIAKLGLHFELSTE
jgi:hypothetical protein